MSDTTNSLNRKELNMTLTKAKIVEKLASDGFFTKDEANQALETTLEVIKHVLEQGDDVLISGFGKFSVMDKRPRRGRNPQTKEELLLSGRRVISFHCSGVLRRKINQSDMFLT
jgi:integration host factor subunit alpha